MVEVRCAVSTSVQRRSERQKTVAERCAVKQEWASNGLESCSGVTCTAAQSNTAHERQTNVLMVSSDAVFTQSLCWQRRSCCDRVGCTEDCAHIMQHESSRVVPVRQRASLYPCSSCCALHCSYTLQCPHHLLQRDPPRRTLSQARQATTSCRREMHELAWKQRIINSVSQ